MTANAFEEDRELAKEAGMTGYLAKPIQIDKMLKEISSFL
ncbi:MAG: response regulator [Lachnospiraceae bacterium]